jgi:hypothetical protein
MSEPLLWASKSALFAVDPATGALRWRLDTGRVMRMFPVGSRLFVLTEDGVLCLDKASGARLGQVTLPFVPTAGIASDTQLFVAGTHGAACFAGDGALLWCAKHEHGEGLSLQSHFVCRDSRGAEQWREAVEATSRFANPGLVWSTLVAQPDLDQTR